MRSDYGRADSYRGESACAYLQLRRRIAGKLQEAGDRVGSGPVRIDFATNNALLSPVGCRVTQPQRLGAGDLNSSYAQLEPARSEIDALQGPTLLEFGSPGCGLCQRVQPLLRAAFASHPGVRHIKIADGRGQRLGRSFRVTHWPTLVFLSGGREVERLVRPGAAEEIEHALARIDQR